MQCAALLLARHNGDDAVIAELIHELTAQADIGSILGHSADIILGTTQRRQIELVGLVGELGNALDVQWFKALDRGGHFQAVEILAVVGESRLGLGALGVLVVEFGLF